MRVRIRSPKPSRIRLACRSSPSSRHRAPGRSPAAARLARSTAESASPIRPCSHPIPDGRSAPQRRPASWDSRAVRGASPSMHVWFKTAERIGQRPVSPCCARLCHSSTVILATKLGRPASPGLKTADSPSATESPVAPWRLKPWETSTVFCPAGGRVVNRRRSLRARSSSSEPGKASFRRSRVGAGARVPTESQLGGLPGPCVGAGQHRAYRNLEAADRAAELAGLVASGVGEIPLGARVGQVGPGVVLGRLGRRMADEDDVPALAQPGHEVAAAGSLGQQFEDGAPDPAGSVGPGLPPSRNQVTTASRRQATSATVGRAAARPGRPRGLMRVGAGTRGWRSSCP